MDAVADQLAPGPSETWIEWMAGVLPSREHLSTMSGTLNSLHLRTQHNHRLPARPRTDSSVEPGCGMRGAR